MDANKPAAKPFKDLQVGESFDWLIPRDGYGTLRPRGVKTSSNTYRDKPTPHRLRIVSDTEAKAIPVS